MRIAFASRHQFSRLPPVNGEKVGRDTIFSINPYATVLEVSMLSKLSSIFRRPVVMTTPTNTISAATPKSSTAKREITKQIEVPISEPAKVTAKEAKISPKEPEVLPKETFEAKVVVPTMEAPMRSAKAKPLTEVTSADAETDVIEIPEDLIASRAFEIWHQEGCPEDRHEANWMQAVAELRAKFAVQ